MRLLKFVGDHISRAVRNSSQRIGLDERRHTPTRPTDGATRACPSCTGVLIFRESYRIFRIERNTLEPAWVCHTHPCGYREFLRQ